ncbi:MAG: hypothetical protein M2R45_03091 [Verrucomicrobia subdivision 3 bacterium]|nr:hypothetical protein [Limisphaerales bacterium]MCS1416576.1 hypothetical protein [Limisphaerales bacterium]
MPTETADQVTLLVSNYDCGNVEHATNGLMLAMDNWINNARSRYRLID